MLMHLRLPAGEIAGRASGGYRRKPQLSALDPYGKGHLPNSPQKQQAGVAPALAPAHQLAVEQGTGC